MLAFAISCLLAGDLPKDVVNAFDKADGFELYSLDPAAGVGEGFHGWLVLGKTTLKGDAAKTVRAAVEKGRKDSDGRQAKCFIPRHGIRVGDLDLVICFECLSARVYRGDKNIGGFLTTGGPPRSSTRR